MNKKSVIAIIILLSAGLIAGCVMKDESKPPANENTILMHIYVFTDHPEPNYELKEGIPENVGIYEFYYKDPKLPGSGAFKKLGSVPLNKLNESVFYAEKQVKRINGTLCVGYPSTNFIDGKACVRVNQTQNEANITVHYWETDIIII